MATVNDYISGSYYDRDNSYNTYQNNRNNSNLFLSGLSVSTDTNSFNLSDYASIKNGSYGKILKAYYANEKSNGVSNSEANSESSKNLTLIKSNADALKKSADALNDESLWEKKKIKKKDEVTKEEVEVEDYDWDAITKAVKTFVDDYNKMLDKAGDADSNGVLRNAVWMIGTTTATENLLAKAGITIGGGNKLEVDEEKLKQANITTLKSLFTGRLSYGQKVAQKANSISNEASKVNGTYTKSGSYSSTLSTLLTNNIDEEA